MIISCTKNNISYNLPKYQKNSKDITVNGCSQSDSKGYTKIPLESLQANFITSFGRYKKISNPVLIDRDNGFPVISALKRGEAGNFYSYKLFLNGKQAGYMDMDIASVIPEDDFVSIVNDNVCPEIKHIRSIAGDKYSGIGTALIKAAVKESYKQGKGGSLWLRTEKGYAYTLSDYRSDQNPIPFYYKLGFRALNPEADKYIKKCIEESDYNALPDSELLVLTSEAAESLKS